MAKIWLLFKQYKWVVLAVVVAGTAKAGWDFYNNQTATAGTAPKLVVVERGNVVSTVAATGTITPVNQVEISSKITGQLTEVRVKENDVVTAGQVLVVLDDQSLKAKVMQAREKLDYSEANYARNRKLQAIGAVSDQSLDSSRMEYQVAKATFDEVNSQLAETIIVSPLAGVVIGKPLPAGQMVAQGISNPMVILTIADMSALQIDALIDETDIGKIKVGQPTEFTVDAYQGKIFTGVVSAISNKATITQNVVYYTVTIAVATDTEQLLKPEMTARVSLHTGESNATLTLPLAAIKTDSRQQQYVVLYRQGAMENVPVVTGLIGEDRVEIRSGLSEGDQVVLALSGQGSKENQGAFPPRLGGGGRH